MSVPGIGDLKKKLRKRSLLWSPSLIALLLIDEYIKEGYFFNPHDVLYPGTHEWFITMIILTQIIILRRTKNEGQGENN